MTHEEEKEPEPQTPAQESDTEQHEDDDLSPVAKEIEEDPSLNPDNEILRDIRGG
ncbi:MAG: hypothetical protein QOD66_3255 [Solirubrobacteraceae bacterium]|jgi:hypothetical protein|nr:hypothetical protein [Solirubrobacteraceae bacterium]